MIAQNGTEMRYEVRTAQFEGPLDLLLHLIEKEELEITQLALAQVTDQFLAYVERMRDGAAFGEVADFLVIAARLVWLKSKALLPTPPTPREDETEDEGDDLVEQLRRYRQYKAAARLLRRRDAEGRHTYIRLAPPPRPRRLTVELGGMTVADLRSAARRLFYPDEGVAPQEAIQRPRLSIVQQIRLLAAWFRRRRQLLFRQVLGPRPTRLEAAVTLQAVLELIKQQAVEAEQEELFGPIVVRSLVSPDAFPLHLSDAETPAGEG